MTNQETIEIQAQARQQGKHTSRYLRRNKLIPAVIYGPKIDNLNIAIPELDATRYTKTAFENTIFVLKSEDSKVNNLKVLKKSSDRHPLSRRPVHLDFYALDMTQLVKVNVELRFEGDPEGLKEGGVPQENRRDIEVECMPTDIPEFFTVDVSALGIGGTLSVADVKIPESAKLITSEEESIYSVGQPKAEEEPTVEAAAEGEGGEAAPAEGGEAAPAAKADGDKKE